MTPCTFGGEQFMKIVLTIRQPIFLKKAVGIQGLLAFCTLETLGMISFPQGCDRILYKKMRK